MSVTKREHVFLADVFDSIAVMFSLTQTDSLTIMPFGIVAYAFMLLFDNLCRNSCICISNRMAPRALTNRFNEHFSKADEQTKFSLIRKSSLALLRLDCEWRMTSSCDFNGWNCRLDWELFALRRDGWSACLAFVELSMMLDIILCSFSSPKSWSCNPCSELWPVMFFISHFGCRSSSTSLQPFFLHCGWLAFCLGKHLSEVSFLSLFSLCYLWWFNPRTFFVPYAGLWLVDNTEVHWPSRLQLCWTFI